MYKKSDVESGDGRRSDAFDDGRLMNLDDFEDPATAVASSQAPVARKYKLRRSRRVAPENSVVAPVPVV